jgi:osmotically-inducible protein OsmY
MLLFAAGCSKPPEPVATQAAVQPSNQETADADVTTGVNTALLRDSTLRSLDITVVTTKGDVRLTGQVDTQSQIDNALTIARGIGGVHSVHDELTLKK